MTLADVTAEDNLRSAMTEAMIRFDATAYQGQRAAATTAIAEIVAAVRDYLPGRLDADVFASEAWDLFVEWDEGRGLYGHDVDSYNALGTALRAAIDDNLTPAALSPLGCGCAARSEDGRVVVRADDCDTHRRGR